MNEKTEKIKKIRNLLLAGGCVITAIICRHLPTNRESGWVAFFQLTRAYLYITLYCVWGISLQRRIVNKTARRCLCGIASLMVFWFVIRTLKYNVFYEPVLRRYSWYSAFRQKSHGQMMSIFMVRDLCFVWHGSLSVFLLCWAY